MTRDFDVIKECELRCNEFGEAEFVNVGWGKKETQFHGSLGKASTQSATGVLSVPSPIFFIILIKSQIY